MTPKNDNLPSCEKMLNSIHTLKVNKNKVLDISNDESLKSYLHSNSFTSIKVVMYKWQREINNTELILTVKNIIEAISK